MPSGALEAVFLLILAFLVLSSGFAFPMVANALGSQTVAIFKTLQGR